jgi:hypothetical protein
MTRNEKEQRIQKQDGKVFENYNISISTAYLNPNYTLVEQTHNEISSTGLLKFFEIIPSGDGPKFTARWDQRAEAMDIDISSDVERFKHSKDGYSGHQPIKVNGNEYQVSVRTPSARIFDGTVRFSLLHKQGFEEGLQFTATLGATVIRAKHWVRACVENINALIRH